jgi:hypothetical protein
MPQTVSVHVIDPLVLAKAGRVRLNEVALRLGVTSRHLRTLAQNPRTAGRVRIAVYELLAEREKLAEVVP